MERMDMSEGVDEMLIAVAAAYLAVDPSAIDLESGPGDLPRWDSFAQIGLIGAVEAKFNIAFDVEEVTMFETLGDIHEAVKRRLST
jgi:acyl carrier protein